MTIAIVGLPVQYQSTKGVDQDPPVVTKGEDGVETATPAPLKFAPHPAQIQAVGEGGKADLVVFGPFGTYNVPGAEQAPADAPAALCWNLLPTA